MNLKKLISVRTLKNTFLAGLAALLISCPMPTPNPQPDPTPSNGNELSPNTKILNSNDASEISSLTDTQITFSQSENYSVGDILVSDITATTPDGLLRKVTRVGDKIVYTESATLEDAIENLTFTANKNISRDIVINSGVSLIDFNLSASADYQGLVSVGGNVGFSSDLVFELNIQNHHLSKLLVKNVVNESSSITLTAGSSLTSFNKEFLLAPPYRFPPFAIYLPTTPPFPIIITPKLEVVAGVEGGVSPLTATASQSLSSELGLDYENGSWSIIKSIHTNPPSYSMNFADVANLKAYVGPKIDFLIYGVAGPYANLDGYLNLELNTGGDYLNLYGGLEVSLGVNMKIFSKTMFDFSSNILDFNWPLASWKKPTTPPPTPTTVTIQPGSDGNDAYVVQYIYPNGYISSYGYNKDFLEIWKETYSGSTDEEALIQFPIQTIPPNTKISSAKLKLYGYGTTNYTSNPTIKLDELTGPWNESTVNWNNKPSHGNYVTSSSIATTNWYEWNVTSLVQRWINGDPNYGLTLYATGNTSLANFKSSEYSDTSKRPILEVTYTQ